MRVLLKIGPSYPTQVLFSTVPSNEGITENSTLVKHNSTSDQ